MVAGQRGRAEEGYWERRGGSTQKWEARLQDSAVESHSACAAVNDGRPHHHRRLRVARALLQQCCGERGGGGEVRCRTHGRHA